MFSYIVEIWDDSIYKSTWKSSKLFKCVLLWSFFKSRCYTLFYYSSLDYFSLQSRALKVLWVHAQPCKKNPLHWLPKIQKKVIDFKISKTLNSKFWMNAIYKEMVWNMGCIALPSMIANRFQFEWCIITWEICRCSHFKHYITYAAPYYKTIFIFKRATHTHPYILEPICLSTLSENYVGFIIIGDCSFIIDQMLYGISYHKT